MPKKYCYCGSPSSYANCCKPFVEQQVSASTPEALLRSRYSAFCVAAKDYLIESHYPATRGLDLGKQLNTTIANTQWCSLRIITTNQTLLPQYTKIEFVAFFKNFERIGQLHDLSKFIYDKKWYYYDSTILNPIKLGRNDFCACGSGKKLKKCHKHI